MTPQTNPTDSGQPRFRLNGIFIHNADKTRVTAYFAELPQVIAEGANVDDAQRNLLDALRFMFDVEREEGEEAACDDENLTTKNFDFELA
jgi:predicted RNase H-like HicB family nuclease